MIENARDLDKYLGSLRERRVTRVALDQEGDQGGHRYKYSISIFQCHDGVEPVIIDVIRTGSCDSLNALLTDPSIVKVMFSCNNDLFMTQNILDCTITPLRDIAVAQKLLGEKIDLAGHIGMDREEKSSCQRADWLKRPIRQKLLEYAARDVTSLLELEERYASRLSENGLYARYAAECDRLSACDYRVDQLRLYRHKFPGYNRLRGDRKRLAKVVWIFRELLGEHFDCPAGYILSRGAMANIVKAESVVSALEIELNRNRREHKRIGMPLIEKIYARAEEVAKDN